MNPSSGHTTVVFPSPISICALPAATSRRRDEIANQSHLSLAENDGLRVLKHQHARIVRARLGEGVSDVARAK